MKKPRVLFPFTEAGLGHIMPMRAIAAKFEALYGDKVEIIRSSFFRENGNEDLKIFEKRLCDTVVKANNNPVFGFFMTFNMDFWGPRLDSWATMKYLKPGANEAAFEYMAQLKPDLVVSTHWATNYYARHIEPMPLTAMYCPDVEMNPLFCYPCDLALVPTKSGYEKARKKYKKRFNDDNLKLVHHVIREEAFSVLEDRRELRKKLGIDEDKFTIMLAEGGYGVGSMKEICEEILERDLPVTLVPVCGKNEELYREFVKIKHVGKCDFRPVGYTDQIFDYIAAADIFCGKSGSIFAEVCFFGVPQIVTHYATNIEKHIGEYFITNVGSAEKIFNPKKVADKIEEYLANPVGLERFRKAAQTRLRRSGAEESARHIFDLLCTRFPELKDEN